MLLSLLDVCYNAWTPSSSTGFVKVPEYFVFDLLLRHGDVRCGVALIHYSTNRLISVRSTEYEVAK
jgi:hypothetical protein